MLRTHTHVDMPTTFHLVVSNLIHRGGWELVEALYGSVYQATWPLPSDPTGPGGVLDVDTVFLRAPDSGLSACQDVVALVLDIPGGIIDVFLFRLGDGTLSPYSAGGAVDGSAEVLGQQPVPFVVGDEVVVYSSQKSTTIAAVNTGTNVATGVSTGYLETAVLTPEVPTPTLGAGFDPYPAYLLIVDNTMAGAPPWFDVTAQHGDGNVFDDLNITAASTLAINHQTYTPTEVLRNAVSFGGAVPTHLVSKCIVMQTAAADFFRGTTPNLFFTSREVPLSTIRIDSTGDEFFCLATRVAVGPL